LEDKLDRFGSVPLGEAPVKHRSREWLSFAAATAAIIAIAISLIIAGRPAGRAVQSRPSPTPSPTPTDGSIEFFNGTIHGWRIATSEVLEQEGLSRNLDPDCDPRQGGASMQTDLDFDLTYLPNDIGTPAHAPAATKWACGKRGFSVSWSYDWDNNPYDGIGILTVERALWGSRSRDLHARKDLVEACSVRGRDAVCVHYEEDDKLGRGRGGYVVVIEDDVFDPYATILTITASGIPYDELLKIAAGIR
jgi:hypothetical protein